MTLNEKKVEIHPDQTELEIIPYVERGEFLLLWQKHRAGLGNSVELTTGEQPCLPHCGPRRAEQLERICASSSALLALSH